MALTQARPDIAGVLSSIDGALTDFSTSSDAMRSAPPVTAVTFTWDEDAETGSAAFSGVNLFDIESLQPGQRVWVDGRPYIITAKTEDAECGFMIELEPAS